MSCPTLEIYLMRRPASPLGPWRPASLRLDGGCLPIGRRLFGGFTVRGKPRSKYGLGNDFAKCATEAGLPSNCRLHGLKKGGMRRLAGAGKHCS